MGGSIRGGRDSEALAGVGVACVRVPHQRWNHGCWRLGLLCAGVFGCHRAPVNPVEAEPQKSAAPKRDVSLARGEPTKVACDHPCALNAVCPEGSCARYPRLVTRSLTSCLVADDGSAKCWTSMEPGKPPIVKSIPPDVAPLLSLEGDSESMCGVSRNQRLHCWGEHWGPAFAEPSPLPVASLPANLTVRHFSNHYFLCALLSDDSLHCTKLSTPDARLQFTSSVSFGTDPAVGVAAGLVTCVLRRSGTVTCFGDGVSSQLDAVGKDVALGRRALALSVGARHACAVLEGGRVACWGDNGRGQLGQGSTLWPGNLPLSDGPKDVSLGKTAEAVGISAGDDHNCVWFADGRLKCWGANDEGQLGLGDLSDRGGKPGQMGDALPFVDLGEGARVLSVDAGPSTTCALLVDHHVKCWGFGYTPPNVHGRTATGDQVKTLTL